MAVGLQRDSTAELRYTYVRTYVYQPSANLAHVFRVYIYIYIHIPRMTERMVASNRAPRDAISDCSTLLDLLTNPVTTTIRTICLRAPPFQRLFRIRFVNDTNFRVLYIYVYIFRMSFHWNIFFKFTFYFCLKLFWLLGASCFFIALSFFLEKKQSNRRL